MEGSKTNHAVAQTFDLPTKGKKRATILKRVGLVLMSIGLAGIGYVIYSYLRPLYVIDGVSITRKDVQQYVVGLEEYKKAQPKVDFGKDLKKVATDDLVLNAAYKAEMKRRNDSSQDKIIKILGEQKRSGSEASRKMQRIRAENNAYQKHLTSLILAQRDLTFVRIGFDTPFYDNKSPEQVKALRQQSIDRLNKTFMPLIAANAPKEQIASLADVNFLDDDTTDDQNYQQYFDGLVSVVDHQQGFIIGATPLNDLENQEYYGVKVDNLKNTTNEIARLTKPGQYTPVFASKTGNFTIIRLDKIYGGEYKNWDDFLAHYKKQYAKSKLFAYDLSPSNAFSTLANATIKGLTNPGLQRAQAASCNTHGVAFYIRSYDLTAFVEIPNGTVVNQYRAAHNCGSQFAGNRSSGVLILDNCLGPAPTWSVVSYADPARYTFVGHNTAVSLNHSYSGWPIWSSENINHAGGISINFYYIQKQQNSAPHRGAALDIVNCDQIAGWVYDSNNNPGGITGAVVIHAYFDQPVGVSGGYGFNVGPANRSRPDVGAAFAGYGVGNNHGFSFNPSTMPGYNIRDGRSHNVWFYAVSAGSYEIFRTTVPACGPREPVVNVDATCDYFRFSARDLDGQTNSFRYRLEFTQNDGAPVVINVGPVNANQTLMAWPPSGISLSHNSGIDWRVTATKNGGNGLSNSVSGHVARCPFNENTVQIVPNSPALFRDEVADTENPNRATFRAEFRLNGPAGGMRGVRVTCDYFIEPLNGLRRSLPGGQETIQHILSSEPYVCVNEAEVSGLQMGDQVCARYTATPGGGRVDFNGNVISISQAMVETEPPICTAIVNRPYLAVYGNDIFAGGGYGDPCNNNGRIQTFTSSGYMGSGVQFAASALGEITGFNSARLRSSSPLPPDGLTIANINDGGRVEVSRHCMHDYYSGLEAGEPATIIGNSEITGFSDSGKYSSEGDLVIGGHNVPVNLPLGRKVALYVDGNVTIRSNIEYAPDSTWTNLASIPSFYLIVKGDIYVEPGVTRLDGMYIMQPKDNTAPPAVTGTMVTCANPNPSNPSVRRFTPAERFSNCQNKLTINGGIQAARVYFDRVGLYSIRDADADELRPGASKAAEVINFSPEMYLSSPQITRDSQSGGSDNSSLRSLPPVL